MALFPRSRDPRLCLETVALVPAQDLASLGHFKQERNLFRSDLRLLQPRPGKGHWDIRTQQLANRLVDGPGSGGGQRAFLCHPCGGLRALQSRSVRLSRSSPHGSLVQPVPCGAAAGAPVLRPIRIYGTHARCACRVRAHQSRAAAPQPTRKKNNALNGREWERECIDLLGAHLGFDGEAQKSVANSLPQSKIKTDLEARESRPADSYPLSSLVPPKKLGQVSRVMASYECWHGK
jgi:hypothetical protein